MQRDIKSDVLKAKILIVDDNLANVALLEGVLDNAGFDNVESLTDPTEVVDAYLKNAYDLILLDIRMPRMDGHEVMAALREKTGDDYLPILVISAQNDMETRHKALAGGARDFINKPFDQVEILQRIENILEIRLLYNERKFQTDLLEKEIRIRTKEVVDREAHLRGIMDNAAEFILTVGPDGLIRTFNQAAETLFRVNAREAGTRKWTDFIVDKNWRPTTGYHEVTGRDDTGMTIPIELSIAEMVMNKEVWLVILGRDISDRRKAEAEMRKLATHDQITELPNRAHALATLTRAAKSREGCILFVSIDGVGRVNDALGHQLGERLLRAVGQRIQESLSEENFTAAWGGNDFIVVAYTERPPPDLGREIIAAVREPYDIAGHELVLNAHVGACRFPHDGIDANLLIRRAGMAVFQGRKEGRSGPTCFAPSMEAEAEERHVLELALRHALDNNELQLHYQPKVDLHSGKVIGMEALARWIHPELGFISPAKFIPIAEETGQIVSIGEWVFHTACKQTKIWHDMGFTQLKTAINLSGRQFDTADVTSLVRGAIVGAGLTFKDIEVEITESSLMGDINEGLKLLDELKSLGVDVAIDDFGTGYSSLSYLQKLPMNTLKIDRSFVMDVTDKNDDAAIARTIIAMARALGLKTVAEGIETEGQQAFLANEGCDIGQGYLFSRPLSVDDFTEFMKKQD